MNVSLHCNVGIDVAKKDFRAVIMASNSQGDYCDKGHKTFACNKSGYLSLLNWCNKLKENHVVTFTIEFTGHYSDALAHFLFQENLTVYMVPPYKSKYFRESLDGDIKNDDRDALNLALMGLERKLIPWQPDSEFFAGLKILARERHGLVKQKTALSNKIHALSYACGDTSNTLKRYREQKKFLSKQLLEINKDIRKYLQKDANVWQKVQILDEIPGVGITTIASVLAETDGFNKTPCIKKLTSYAGYKVTIKDSGDIKRKGRLTKKGNKFIRKALHMPVLCMIQKNPLFIDKYQELKSRKSKPCLATAAIERKALILMYTLYKNGTKFDVNYNNETKVT